MEIATLSFKSKSILWDPANGLTEYVLGARVVGISWCDLCWVERDLSNLRNNEMSDPRHLRSIKSGTANLVDESTSWSTGLFLRRKRKGKGPGGRAGRAGVGGIDQEKKKKKKIKGSCYMRGCFAIWNRW